MPRQQPSEKAQRARSVCLDDKAQLQPATKEAAQKLGVKEQKEAAKQQVESPGQPAKGE